MADSERVTGQLADLTNKYSEAQRNAQKAMALFKDTSNDKAKTEMDRCGARYGWCKAVKKVGEPCDKNKRKKCDRLPCALIAKGSSMEERCRQC